MSLASLYQLALRAHSGIPYHVFRGGGAFPALHYYLEVTRRCNLRCQMCQYIKWLRTASGAEQKEGELSTEEWKQVIDQTGRFSLLTFTGGEPWVRSDFLELLEYACARRVTHCISNGVLLNEERAQQCIALAPKGIPHRGLVSLGISLDAPSAVEYHDGAGPAVRFRRDEGFPLLVPTGSDGDRPGLRYRPGPKRMPFPSAARHPAGRPAA